MNEWIHYAKEFWYLALGIGGALGTVIARLYSFFRKKKIDEKNSEDLLFEELERYKVTVIRQIAIEVEQKKTIAELRSILDKLEINCPDCYNNIMDKNSS